MKDEEDLSVKTEIYMLQDPSPDYLIVVSRFKDILNAKKRNKAIVAVNKKNSRPNANNNRGSRRDGRGRGRSGRSNRGNRERSGLTFSSNNYDHCYEVGHKKLFYIIYLATLEGRAKLESRV